MALFVAGLTVAGTSRAVAEELREFQATRIRMGVPFQITVYAANEATANAAMESAFARLRELNRTFSDYDPRSEARRLTTEIAPGAAVPISSDMRRVLTESLEISRQTDGAFDVTVSPVVKLWRRSYRSKELPAAGDLQEALANVGWRFVTVDSDESTVTFQRPGVELDFGGIAKGDACDQVLAVLKEKGLSRAMVEAGGDLACGDPPPGKAGWRIAVAALDQPEEEASDILLLKNQGVATSGDAYQFLEVDGVRYSHIVDPRTGLGLTTHANVTVVAPTGSRADALASAVSVMGPERGRCLVESLEGVAMRMVFRDADGEERVAESRGFGELVEKRDTPAAR